MKKLYSFLLIIAIFFSVSCSLNYLNSENSEASIPEFCFKNASYTKYEASKKNVSLKAEQLEQYKSDNAVFAKNAVFETYDTDGKEDTGGSCQLISANTKKEIYTLYGDIQLRLPKQDMLIEADSLNFNKKTEQITSGKSSEVRLKKNDIMMQGYGFSASGVSKSFSFVDTVSGTIITDDDKTSAIAENVVSENEAASEE
ncbi:MAG: LPS export ABC transporter periplasmic protein LptC [Treponema sp.]|uniref:LPS export ABC transporter periplasmic protein LptC n=1 Tax=Treponema sp. TaxID=166 RepID=UPI002A91BBDA|nr:LPS export ABC transporter periplasmic protein LptC [Treponema sp.]MDY6397029.1 LPS export ABC transporter periplasmic protein LptC [Treponema sp.]